MTLEDLANLSDVVAGIGVIASLIFVGFQMRQSTLVAKAQIHENMTSGYLSFANVVMPYAKIFSKGISANLDEFDTLSPEEKLIYFSTIFCLFKHFEQMHSQYLSGLIDKETWKAWSEHIRMYFHQAGVQIWWSYRKKSFVKSFRIFLDKSSIPTDSPSIVDLMLSKNMIFGMRHWKYQSFLHVEDAEQPGASSTDELWAQGRLYLEDAEGYKPDAVGTLELQTDQGVLSLAVKADLDQTSVPARFNAFGEVQGDNPAKGARYELEGWAFVGEDGEMAEIKGTVRAVRGSNLQPNRELGGQPIGTVGLFIINNPKRLGED